MTESIRPPRSISQLKNYTKCGEAYRLEKFHRDQLPKSPAAWTISGSALHEAYETWERSDRSGSLADQFVPVFDRMIEEAKVEQPDLRYWQKPPRTKSVEQDIKNHRKRFIERDAPNYEVRCRESEWEILRLEDGELALELQFEMTLGNSVVRGAIDKVQWWPKEEHVTIEDLKTGSPENAEYDQRQLGVYGLAIQELLGINPKFGRYWFTKVDRGSAWFNLGKYTHGYFEKEFELLNRAVEQELFFANPGKGCDLCSVKPWCKEKGWLELGQPLFAEEEVS